MKTITLSKQQVINLQKEVQSFFCGLEDFVLTDSRVISVNFNSDFSCTYNIEGSECIGFGLSWYGLTFEELENIK